MTHSMYMDRLRKGIVSMPKDRQAEILEDIDQHFVEGIASGASEETLSEQLGAPEMLAKEYTANQALAKAKDHPTMRNIFVVIWAAIGMGMLNLIFVFPLWIGAFSIWISLLVSGIAMAISGVAVILAAILGIISSNALIYVEYPLIALTSSIAVACLGALLGIGMLYIGKWFGKLTLRYLQKNIEIIAGKRKEK